MRNKEEICGIMGFLFPTGGRERSRNVVVGEVVIGRRTVEFSVNKVSNKLDSDFQLFSHFAAAGIILQ